jgi:hypothetical protein
LQLGILLEHKSGVPADRRMQLDPFVGVKLDDGQEKIVLSILSFLYDHINKDKSDDYAEYLIPLLWAIGKARKSSAYPWFRKSVIQWLDRIPDNLRWQALIALENFCDDGFTNDEKDEIRLMSKFAAAGARQKRVKDILDRIISKTGGGMKSCKSAKSYKGTRRPTCNNGNPCEACVSKYNRRKKKTRT